MVADAFAYLYASALQRALELVSSTSPAIRGSAWPRTPMPPARSALPAPLYCDPTICTLDSPPGCVYYEYPKYGQAQISVVPAGSGNSLSANTDSGWFHWIGPKSSSTGPDSGPDCAHPDGCGAMQPRDARAGWLVFALPQMTIGKIFVCCWCVVFSSHILSEIRVALRCDVIDFLLWFCGSQLRPAMCQ
jgi:hypothetical protein